VITRLWIKNFKAWADTGEIRLAPLTIIFGGNSAGKSSIPQLLLMLKQTAESPDRNRALHFGDERTLVDLGLYTDVIHDHDTSNELEFQVRWQLSPGFQIEDPIGEERFSGDEIEFSATLSGETVPRVTQMKYQIMDKEEEMISLGLRLEKGSGEKYKLLHSGYRPIRQPGRAWPLPRPQRFYRFPDEATAYYQNLRLASDLALSLEETLRSVFHLGPLRDPPRRSYGWSGEAPDHVGARGNRFIEAILAGAKRAYNWKPKTRTSSLEEVVAWYLREMGLIHDFHVKLVGPKLKEYEVTVQTTPSSPQVYLTDVGFGVSQVLPVIVEAFYVPAGSTVIMEQPEIHLHPRVEAMLADLFVGAIGAREHGVERNCQFLLESHSEHMLRRLQRKIAEEAISKDQVALYFIAQTEEGPVLEPLEVDDYGNIKNWPKDFFGDVMADHVARAQAEARRKKANG
jgi:predicted ATPase